MRTALLAASLLLVAALAQAAETPAAESPALRILSSPPDMVSGGRALVELTGARPGFAVTLDGKDVTPSFRLGDDGAARAVLTGMATGPHRLAATAGAAAARLDLLNHKINGPIFSGPHQTPFICQTERFQLPDGTMLGAALDRDCSIATRVVHVYKSSASGKFVPLAPELARAGAALPADVARTTTLAGAEVPFVVRLEIGTIDRGIYRFALLHDPTREAEPTPFAPPAGWNRRLIWSHGGGCPGGWNVQGNTTGEVLDELQLARGYAVASSSLNVPAQSCNAVLAAEAVLMTKAHLITEIGVPLFTLSIGCSGGSYSSLQIADAYPGLYDGILISCVFPDPVAIAHPGLDARLLTRYFAVTAPGSFTPEQQRAVGGYAVDAGLAINAAQAQRTDPVPGRDPAETGVPARFGAQSAVFSGDVPEAQRYHPQRNRTGARPTIYDVAATFYGRDPKTGFARRPFDNVGVQYGLAALQAGVITGAQFVDLNRRVGGYDNDANFIASRSTGDGAAIRNAYTSGLVLGANGGLQSIPILAWNQLYTDQDPRGEYHLHYHVYSVRDRLLRAGNGDNFVLWSGGVGLGDLIGPPAPDSAAFLGRLREATLSAMESWLTALAADRSADPAPLRVSHARPKQLVDGCFTRDGEARFLAEPQTFGGPGTSRCNDLWPAYGWPRRVAGQPVAADILKCARKPVDPNDYNGRLDAGQLTEIKRIFSGGVCDWSRLGEGQVAVRPWTSYGPAPSRL